MTSRFIHSSPSIDANTWFVDRFGVALPRGLREQAQTMDWGQFVTTYGYPSGCSGPLRLGQWSRGRTRSLGSCRYRATIAHGDDVRTDTAVASGPIAAVTAMLHEHGVTVETVRFHQMRSGDGHTVTFVCGSDGARTEWAMGWARDATESALRAVIGCANRLLAD